MSVVSAAATPRGCRAGVAGLVHISQTHRYGYKIKTPLSRTGSPTEAYLLCYVSHCLALSGLWTKCREAFTFISYLVKQSCQILPNAEMETKIPKDVRTITKRLQVDPELKSHVCCTQCYSLYDIETSPLTCTYKATMNSSLCGNELFDGIKLRGMVEVAALSIRF
ncbi:hypothetical protein VP01_2434g4 [Puccinia sorghi]|uniref:Uncharacterized protein n=1 Tax=Puccinia sorghi TaxID=27349 RepID=A0A0L6V6A5_9BASI|nr:hypothetical protein VP01_2434g4 [Puccinia sorghi]